VSSLNTAPFTEPYTTIVGSVMEPTGESYTDYSGLIFHINDDSLVGELHPYYTNDLHRTFRMRENIAEYVRANNITVTGW
jgi:hypothetical protein